MFEHEKKEPVGPINSAIPKSEGEPQGRESVCTLADKEHLASDRVFFEELISHCQNAGIPIRAQPEEIIGLLYPLVLTILHEDDFVANNLSGGFDLLLELIAAFYLGEVEIQLQKPINPTPSPEEGYTL